MYVSLGIFTQYRRELMGVATVLILLCHSLLPPAIHCPNDILRWIKSPATEESISSCFYPDWACTTPYAK